MGNCGPHGKDLLDPTEQVSVITVPPNCTSMLQPIEMGIMADMKVRYRSMHLSRILAIFEDRSQLRNAAKNLTAGLKGLNEKHGTHML